MARTTEKFNKIVNVAEDGEITVLDELFQYENGFKGATGSTFYPVSKDEYEELTNQENVISSLKDCIELERTQFNSYVDMFEAMEENDEIEDFVFDTSDSELWDYLRDELNLSSDEAYIFTCSGGGRCFNENYQGNHNPELSELIRKQETK